MKKILLKLFLCVLLANLVGTNLIAQCGSNEVQIDIKIKTGNAFSDEQYWYIVGASNDTVARGGEGEIYQNNKTYNTTACIESGVEYTFYTWDAYGDGWFQYSSYEVSYGGIVIINNNGDEPDDDKWDGAFPDNETVETFSVVLPTNEIGVTSIDKPNIPCNLSSNESIGVTIKNFGINPQSNFNVGYKINGVVVASELITSTIEPGSTLSYTFTTKADLSAYEIYNIVAYTALAQDVITSNDTFSIDLQHTEPALSKVKDENIALLDNNSDGITSSMFFCGLPESLDGCLKIKSLTINSLVHTWVEDLDIYLISPGNDTLLISTDNGGDGSNYTNVIFTDTASKNISTVTSGIASGYYHIEGSGGFGQIYNGNNPNGEWKLWIKDDTYLDVGTLHQWSMEFEECSNTDIGILEIFNPISGCKLSENESINITIKNFGTLSVSDFKVNYLFNGQQFSEIVSNAILPGATLNYTFNTTIDLSGEGEYPFTVFTVLSSDINANNDSLSIMVNSSIPPSVDLGADTTLCNNELLLLNAGGGDNLTYNWNTSETTQTILIDASTTGVGVNSYNVEVTNEFGCSSYDTILITVTACTGITNHESEDIILYPNPMSDFLIVKTNDPEFIGSNVSIFNLPGQLFYEGKVSGTTLTIDVSNFPKGFYFLKIENLNNLKVNKVIEKKLVK